MIKSGFYHSRGDNREVLLPAARFDEPIGQFRRRREDPEKREDLSPSTLHLYSRSGLTERARARTDRPSVRIPLIPLSSRSGTRAERLKMYLSGFSESPRFLLVHIDMLVRCDRVFGSRLQLKDNFRRSNSVVYKELLSSIQT